MKMRRKKRLAERWSFGMGDRASRESRLRLLGCGELKREMGRTMRGACRLVRVGGEYGVGGCIGGQEAGEWFREEHCLRHGGGMGENGGGGWCRR